MPVQHRPRSAHLLQFLVKSTPQKHIRPLMQLTVLEACENGKKGFETTIDAIAMEEALVTTALEQLKEEGGHFISILIAL